MSPTTSGHPVILFDGACGFCDRMVDFICEHDPNAVFRFASRQSPEGQALLAAHDLPSAGVGSLILIEDGTAYTKSTASLRIARRLEGGIRRLAAFAVVPSPIRDVVYTLVSRNRQRLLRTPPTCKVPTAERRARFLSSPPTE